RWPATSSPLILSLTFLSEELMKYLFSRLLIRAAVFGAKKPFNLMDAILDLPIIVILPVRIYWACSVLPWSTFKMPIRSLGGTAAGGFDRPRGLPVAGRALWAAIISCARFVSSTTVASRTGVTGPAF